MTEEEQQRYRVDEKRVNEGETDDAHRLVQPLVQAFYRFHANKMAFHDQDYERNRNEAKVLLLLYRAESDGLRVSELSEKLRVSSPFVTQLLNHFEAHNMIERKKDDEDRRVVKIELTAKGRSSAEAIIQYQHDLFTGLVDFLGEKDCVKLTSLLHKAFDYLDKKKKRG